MKTKGNRKLIRRKNKKHTRKLHIRKKSGKKWITAIAAAEKTLLKTGNIEAARESLRKQALTNARKLFGSIHSNM